MSGECNKCGGHAKECRCVGQDIYEENIDAYITTKEFEKLIQYVDFLPAHLYPSREPIACKELGRIRILVGPTLRFHLKRCEIPLETHEELLNQQKDTND